MGILDKVESFILRSTWIDEIPEAIAATVSGPMGCAPIPPPAPEMPSNPNPLAICVDGPQPAWISQPGDGYVVAQSECDLIENCNIARHYLQDHTLSELLLNGCSSSTPTSMPGGQEQRSASGRLTPTLGSYLGSCVLPDGQQGLKLYLKLASPGVICSDASPRP